MKMIKLFALLLCVILAACAPTGATQEAGGTQAAPASLDNTQWKLLFFREGEVETPVIDGSNLTLVFEADQRAGGSGGCNSFGGTYQTQGENLKFSDLVSTLMACADMSLTDQEGQYMSKLQAAERYEISGDQLTIWHSGGNGRLIFTRASAQ